MDADTLSLSSLETLAKDAAGSEWAAVRDSAAPLAPEDVPGKLLVGTGYYGEYLLDGWHRVAGVLAWAREAGIDADDDVELPVWRCSEAESEAFA